MFRRTTAINKLLKLKKRTRIVQGGTSAGKTFGVLPILIDRCCKSKGLEVSVVSSTLPHLRRGAIRDFKKVMRFTGRWDPTHWHGTDLIYTFANGSYIEFFSVEQEDKVRGPRRDVLYVNECNKISFETYHQLAIRTRKVIWLDFNPSNEFWVNEELEGDEDADRIILTYKDNETLDAAIIKEIEKAKEKAFHDPEHENVFHKSNIKNKYWANWWKVYGLGQLGSLSGAILSNWEYGVFNETLPSVIGLDFGVVDPDAMVRIAVDVKEKILYWDEMLYESGLSTDSLYRKIREAGVKKDLIIADSQAARTIIDLKALGLNIRGVSKNKIVEDIKLLQEYKIILTERSVNLARELRFWVWLSNKAQVPIDAFNHAIDAARYATQTKLAPRKKKPRNRAV